MCYSLSLLLVFYCQRIERKIEREKIMYRKKWMLPTFRSLAFFFFFFLAIRWIARAHNAHQNGLLLTLRCPSPASLPQAVSSRPNRIERKRMKKTHRKSSSCQASTPEKKKSFFFLSSFSRRLAAVCHQKEHLVFRQKDRNRSVNSVHQTTWFSFFFLSSSDGDKNKEKGEK